VVAATASTGDYVVRAPVGEDNAAPAIIALSHGELGEFLRHLPVMGLTSLAPRAPVATLVRALGGGAMLTYRAGAFVCLLPAVILSAWSVQRARLESQAWAGVAAAAIIVLGPLTRAALAAGHPEEVLAAALVTAAVLAARADRPGWAGVLLGASVGAKQWSLVGLAPVLIGLTDRRRRACAGFAGTAFALCVLPVLPHLGDYLATSRGLASTHIVNADSLLWPIGTRLARTPGSSPAAMLPAGLTRADVTTGALALASIVGAIAVTRSRERADGEALRLLCMLALVRCAVDPFSLRYYYVALVVPLTVWEVGARRHLPLTALLTSAAVTVAFGSGAGLGSTASWAIIAGTCALVGVRLHRGGQGS
jgi:hypothetical protein